MRTFSLLIIVLVASLSLAQDCNNPLLAFFGIRGLDDPQSGEGLLYCSTLQNDGTCCSADVVASFQDRANRLTDKLNNYFAAKDLYLAQLRNSYLVRFNNYLQNITDNYTDDLQTIRQTDSNIADQLQARIDRSRPLSAAAQSINDQFQKALYDYQKIRTKCFTTALEVHTSAWCLACNPNYATQGVNDDGTVNFSDSLCKTISDACWPFFNQGAMFNPLIRAREAYWQLRAVAVYLGNFSVTNQVFPFSPLRNPYNPLSTQLPVTVPVEWAGNAADPGVVAQCADLWDGDELLAELLTIGVVAEAATEEAEFNEESVLVVDETGTSTRLLERLLQEVVWVTDPATGLNVSYVITDPGAYYGLSDLSDLTDETNLTDNDAFD